MLIHLWQLEQVVNVGEITERVGLVGICLEETKQIIGLVKNQP